MRERIVAAQAAHFKDNRAMVDGNFKLSNAESFFNERFFACAKKTGRRYLKTTKKMIY
jgi:hypothetical protein